MHHGVVCANLICRNVNVCAHNAHTSSRCRNAALAPLESLAQAFKMQTDSSNIRTDNERWCLHLLLRSRNSALASQKTAGMTSSTRAIWRKPIGVCQRSMEYLVLATFEGPWSYSEFHWRIWSGVPNPRRSKKIRRGATRSRSTSEK